MPLSTPAVHLLNLCYQVSAAYDAAGIKPLGDDFDTLMVQFKVTLAQYTTNPAPKIVEPVLVESRLPQRY
jgi:hypothetical protein